MKEQIEVITYEQDRLNYFTDLMKKAQERYKRIFKKHKDAPYLSEEAQALSDAGRETHFLGDVVGMLEKDYRKQSEWISVEDRMPEREGTYLVCTYKRAIKFDFYGHYGVRDKPQFDYDVTHWMPLPQPPEMKGGAE